MKKTIATAESCTGGLLGVLLTEAPGASDFYLGGVIAYHNRAKQKLLGVSSATLRRHGAVSAQTALEMADGVRKKLGAAAGISITGIAGPGGGTKEKPVGLVYVALADGKRRLARRFLFSGIRSQVRKRAARAALKLLQQKPL